MRINIFDPLRAAVAKSQNDVHTMITADRAIAKEAEKEPLRSKQMKIVNAIFPLRAVVFGICSCLIAC